MSAQILPFGNVYTLEYRERLIRNIGQAQIQYILLAKDIADCPWWRPGRKASLMMEAAKLMRNIKAALVEYRLQYKQSLILKTRVTTR